MSIGTATAWSPERLRATIVGVGLLLVALIAGAAYAVVLALDVDDPTSAAVTDLAPGADRRDVIAAKPMLELRESDLEPAAPAIDQLPALSIPAAGETGPAGVRSGYPRTPEGAVGQLSDLTVTALNGLSLERADEVYYGWAIRPADDWPLLRAIADFHRASGTVDGDPDITVTIAPVGGQVKGTDGPDWVLACVQLDVKATVLNQARIGFGHCERMAWQSDRWMIAPGEPPATAPSTWPRSQRSVDAGWRPLTWAEAQD